MLNTGNLDPLREKTHKTFTPDTLPSTHTDLYTLYRSTRAHTPAQLHDGGVLAAVEVELPKEALFHVVEHVPVTRRTLAARASNLNTSIPLSCPERDRGVCSGVLTCSGTG